MTENMLHVLRRPMLLAPKIHNIYTNDLHGWRSSRNYATRTYYLGLNVVDFEYKQLGRG